MIEEEVVESSQDDEIELRIPSMPSPEESSYLSPRGYTFPESSIPHNDFSYQSQSCSYDGDTEPHAPPSPASLGASMINFIPSPEEPEESSYFSPRGYTFPESSLPQDDFSHESQSYPYDGEIEAHPPPSPATHKASMIKFFRDLKSDYKATCEELEMTYESQSTVPESLLVGMQDSYSVGITTLTTPNIESESSESSLGQGIIAKSEQQAEDSKPANYESVEGNNIPSGPKHKPCVSPISSRYFHTPKSSLSRHRAATRARRSAHDIAALERFLLRERQRYKRLMAIVLGKGKEKGRH